MGDPQTEAEVRRLCLRKTLDDSGRRQSHVGEQGAQVERDGSLSAARVTDSSTWPTLPSKRRRVLVRNIEHL